MAGFMGKSGVYVIAEVGGNHEGDFEFAVKLARLAADSGADAVKFQIYTGNTLVNERQDPDRNRHFKRFELGRDRYLELAAICREAGVDFLASVWNLAALEWADPLLPLYKIGSGDLTAYDLLARIAETGKPILLSTGLSTLDEVLAATAFIQERSAAYKAPDLLGLLQCSSMYPIPDQDANLRVMDSLRKATGLTVGYSDHTVGMAGVRAAVALGAQVIEKHFTDSREGKTFRDHKVSATREEMREFVEEIPRIRAMLGSDQKRPVPSELDAGHVRSFRRAVYPICDLPQGHRLAEGDLVTLRPCDGIGAEHFFDLVGRRLLRDVQRLEPLSFDILTKTRDS